MKRLLLVMVSLVLVSSLILIGCAQPAQPTAKVYELRIQSGYPRGDLSMDLLKDFAASAEKRSNGQLKISVFADPELVPVDQLFGATKKGTLDMLHAAGTFWGGILPIGEVEFGLPYGFRIPGATSFEDAADKIRKFFFNSGLVDLLRAEYAKKNLYWLDMHVYGPVPFDLSTRPVVTYQDWKGLKISTIGIWSEWYGMAGATGTSIPAGEDYMALKLGTIDANQWDVSAVTGLGIHEVAPYWIRGVENDHCVGHILVNMDVWNSLPENLKKNLADAAKDYYSSTVTNYKKEVSTVEDLVKQGKVKESRLDQDCINKFTENAHVVWDEWAKSDEATAKAIQLLRNWKW